MTHRKIQVLVIAVLCLNFLALPAAFAYEKKADPSNFGPILDPSGFGPILDPSGFGPILDPSGFGPILDPSGVSK